MHGYCACRAQTIGGEPARSKWFFRYLFGIAIDSLFTLAITDSIMVAGFLGLGGTSHRSMDMDRFCSRPSCFVSCALRASKVMPPAAPWLLLVLVTTVASWNSARVSSSTSPSSNFIPFSSIQARITCCSSFSWIKPSPEKRRFQRALITIFLILVHSKFVLIMLFPFSLFTLRFLWGQVLLVIGFKYPATCTVYSD